MRKFKFGSCLPESIKIYNRLKRQGKNPIFIEGWAEVNDPDGILEPDNSFLKLFYPKLIKAIKNGSDYPRVLPHTWIECVGKLIDKTRNQFDIYGGIIVYYEKMKYIPKIKITPDDIMNWFDEADYIITRDKFIHYPDEIKTGNEKSFRNN